MIKTLTQRMWSGADRVAGTRTAAGLPWWKSLATAGTRFGVFRERRRTPLASAHEQTRELERLNSELTAKLVDLGIKKEEAERANTCKTRFLASASHDLRQPMHAISLLVGILRERIHGPDEQQLVGKIETSVHALENLFGSLLDITKLDAGAVKPSISTFPIADILRPLEVNYAPLAQEKGLALKVLQSRAMVSSDAQLLGRILGNLVANAIRYTPKGRILVGCRRRGAALQVLVCDTGVGIPAAHLDDIFDEFFQLANPDHDRSQGLGLGLSIVKRSAELLGHRLVARSRPGRGSTFGVEVPIVRMSPCAPPAALGKCGNAGRLAGAFVAIIDDEQENRYAMDALFRQWGCHVVSAAAADEAMEKLATHLRVPDLVVCDYHLRGGETGLAAVLQLRMQADRLIPAILVTGDLNKTDVARGARALEVVTNPVNRAKLREIAESALSNAADTP